jgi:hypothetical protein
MSEENKHALLGGSNCERWVQCPGSVDIDNPPKDSPDSDASIEGTIAHDLMEQVLSGTMDLEDAPMLYNEDAVEAVREYQDIILEELFLYGGELLVEEKVDNCEALGVPKGMAHGYLDTAIVNVGATLHVYDLKFGVGIVVEAFENFQELYYAIPIVRAYDYNFTHVTMHIFQPRARHPEGPHREWTVTIEEFKTWEYLIKKGAQRVLKRNRSRYAGAWCKFCPEMVDCPEVTKVNSDTSDFEKWDLKDDEVLERMPTIIERRDLAPKLLSSYLRKTSAVRAWAKAVEDYADDYIKRGGVIPGFKLVEARGSRKWARAKDAAEVFKKLLSDNAFEKRELLSPAQMEKAIKAKMGYKAKDAVSLVNKYTARVSSGVTLVPESDSRSSVADSHKAAFSLIERKED